MPNQTKMKSVYNKFTKRLIVICLLFLASNRMIDIKKLTMQLFNAHVVIRRLDPALLKKKRKNQEPNVDRRKRFKEH